jgi:hypothetical protein
MNIRRAVILIAISLAIPVAVLVIFPSNMSGSKIKNIEQTQNRIFIALTIFSALTVLASIAQYFVGNKLAEAYKSDSDLQSTEAKTIGANANERAEKLENENLLLKTNLKTLEIEVAEAKTKQAEAEIKASFAADRVGGRFIDGIAFTESLKILPKFKGEILYNPEDLEAYTLASSIYISLVSAGWLLRPIRPVLEKDADLKLNDTGLPLLARVGAFSDGYSGICVFSKKRTKDIVKFSTLLADALSSPISNTDEDPKLEEGVIRIIIGPRAYLPMSFPWGKDKQKKK